MRFRVANLFVAGGIYLFLAALLAQDSPAPLLIAVICAGACMLVTHYMIKSSEARRTGHTMEFRLLKPATVPGILMIGR
jgi:hypothetical protein